ncbi:MAG: DUF5615 family PIN-like protein [Planctomycetota bacterium]|nr:DUF5615 family PIN-like protein [Planctomycetota bacterium]
MRIKLDENIPRRLARLLGEAGHDVDTVPQEDLTGQADAKVWKAAQASGRLLVTQDLDFSDTRRYTPGRHHGILLIRLREPGRQGLLERIESLFRTEDVNAWKGCFVVVTDRKTRVVRP